ncbi:MAG: hypothetical protein NXY57DRAFT_982507 [Lentinula lateritia]|nr:MAG: hypothetical protein NXY57DRAFT_982507 [Lentinula lateritia]
MFYRKVRIITACHLCLLACHIATNINPTVVLLTVTVLARSVAPSANVEPLSTVPYYKIERGFQDDMQQIRDLTERTGADRPR